MVAELAGVKPEQTTEHSQGWSFLLHMVTDAWAEARWRARLPAGAPDAALRTSRCRAPAESDGNNGGVRRRAKGRDVPRVLRSGRPPAAAVWRCRGCSG